jgi:plastocyanin domain-containing protein
MRKNIRKSRTTRKTRKTRTTRKTRKTRTTIDLQVAGEGRKGHVKKNQSVNSCVRVYYYYYYYYYYVCHNFASWLILQ